MTDSELYEIEDLVKDAVEYGSLPGRTAGKVLGLIDEVRKLNGQTRSLLKREMERKSVVESE